MELLRVIEIIQIPVVFLVLLSFFQSITSSLQKNALKRGDTGGSNFLGNFNLLLLLLSGLVVIWAGYRTVHDFKEPVLIGGLLASLVLLVSLLVSLFCTSVYLFFTATFSLNEVLVRFMPERLKHLTLFGSSLLSLGLLLLIAILVFLILPILLGLAFFAGLIGASVGQVF
ncbi:hypothetical protein HZC08_01725 [Candidatus Micrarchaeota archaeon]|nr:hypothetical protein [Candidatus Micrarchaeota archaeon]